MSLTSIISTAIPESNFEKVLDRIGEILTVELANQLVLRPSDEWLDVTVFKERIVPYGHAELPTVNVKMHMADFNGQTLRESQSDTRFIIECAMSAQYEDGDTANESRGDTLSKVKLNKLMGVIRYILEHPGYINLGFTQKFIGRRVVDRLYYMAPIHQDAESVTVGRVELFVKFPECNGTMQGVELAEHLTGVKIEETDKGYKWVYEAP